MMTHKRVIWNAAIKADIRNRHRKWPLGVRVAALIGGQYVVGEVFKHWRKSEYGASCSVVFNSAIDRGDGYGPRTCLMVPFRSLKIVSTRAEVSSIRTKYKAMQDRHDEQEAAVRQRDAAARIDTTISKP